MRQGVAGAVCSILPAPLCCSKSLYFTSQQKVLTATSNTNKKPPPRRSRRLRAALRGNVGDEDEEEDGLDEADEDAQANQGDNLIYFEDGDRMDMSVYTDLRNVNAAKIEQAILGQKRIYVDKHVLMHRLYVGLSSQMGVSTSIHNLLAEYLPITRFALLRPTMGLDRSIQLAEAWVKAMRDSRAAADEADLLKVPSFHWARVYRI